MASLTISFTLGRELTSTVLSSLLLRRCLACLQKFLGKPGVEFRGHSSLIGRGIYPPSVLQFLSHPSSREGVMTCRVQARPLLPPTPACGVTKPLLFSGRAVSGLASTMPRGDIAVLCSAAAGRHEQKRSASPPARPFFMHCTQTGHTTAFQDKTQHLSLAAGRHGQMDGWTSAGLRWVVGTDGWVPDPPSTIRNRTDVSIARQGLSAAACQVPLYWTGLACTCLTLDRPD